MDKWQTELYDKLLGLLPSVNEFNSACPALLVSLNMAEAYIVIKALEELDERQADPTTN